MNEMYTARLGQGAYLNGKRITASEAQTVDLPSELTFSKITN